MSRKTKSYLVTGGCGFIGSHLCEALVAAGHRVRVLDNLVSGTYGNLADGAELIFGDIADRALIAETMTDCDGCFHLAAIPSVEQSNLFWAETHRVNLTGTINVLDAARPRDGRAAVPVVYASSAAVYGDPISLPLSEDHPARPNSAYGADKLGCELHAGVAASVHAVPATGLRLFNVYGPRQRIDSMYAGVISIFARQLLADAPLMILGDGQQSRDFVFVGDVVRFFLAAMESPAEEARIFNVCTGRPTTIIDLAEQMARLLDLYPELSFAQARAGDISASVGNPRHAARALGLTAATDLAEGLLHLFAELDDGLGEPGEVAAA